MNKLLEELLRRGYKGKMWKNNVVVNLSLLPLVFITHNIELNIYELKVKYGIYIFSLLLMFMGSRNVIGYLLCLGHLVVLLISFLITKSKMKPLAQFIDSINGEVRA